MKESVQKLIGLYPEILRLSAEDIRGAIKQSKTDEERDFYMTVEGFLIGIEQKKVIEKGEY